MQGTVTPVSFNFLAISAERLLGTDFLTQSDVEVLP
jgi:hypothetical protein